MGSSASKTASSASSTSFSATVSSSPTTKLASDFPSPTVHKAFSFPTLLVHHPPARKGDTHHLVSLTSTSYGSLLLIDLDGSKAPPTHRRFLVKNTPDPSSLDSFSPDSVINTWELMDGLDDEFEFEIPKPGKRVDSDVCPKPDPDRNVGLSGGSALKLDESYVS